ncbi:hypothetical protein JW859_02935 [bacterium]|nr:hypothetical protein [bacterium]
MSGNNHRHGNRRKKNSKSRQQQKPGANQKRAKTVIPEAAAAPQQTSRPSAEPRQLATEPGNRLVDQPPVPPSSGMQGSRLHLWGFIMAVTGVLLIIGSTAYNYHADLVTWHKDAGHFRDQCDISSASSKLKTIEYVSALFARMHEVVISIPVNYDEADYNRKNDSEDPLQIATIIWLQFKDEVKAVIIDDIQNTDLTKAYERTSEMGMQYLNNLSLPSYDGRDTTKLRESMLECCRTTQGMLQQERHKQLSIIEGKENRS